VLVAVIGMAFRYDAFAASGKPDATARLQELEERRAQEEFNFQMGLGLSLELRNGYVELAAAFPDLPEMVAWSEYRLAESDYSTDQFAKALERLGEVARSYPGTAVALEAQLLAAEILDSPYNPSRDPEAAEATLAQAERENPGNARAKVAHLARQAVKQVAKREFKAAADTLANQLQGQVFRAKGPMESPIDRTIRGKHDEELSRAYRQLAFARAGQGDYTGAYATLGAVIGDYKVNGENPYNYFTFTTTLQDLEYQQALALAAQGDKAAAVAELKAFAARYPDSHLSLRAQARIQELDPQPVVQPTAVPGNLGTRGAQPTGTACVCGPAALQAALSRLGHEVEIDTLVKDAGTSTEGTTMAGLLAAARVQGVQAYGLHLPKSQLSNVRLPAVVLWYDHFVTVTAVSGNEITYYDPLVGRMTKSTSEFHALWDGNLIVFADTEANALQSVAGARVLSQEELARLRGRYLCGNAGGRDTPGCDGPCDNDYEGSDPQSDGDMDGANDDVNRITGNDNLELPDLTMPGTDFGPLDFRPSFNSQAATTDSFMGPGWSPPYSDSIVNLSGNRQWVQSNGTRLTYTLNVDGTYTAPPGNFDKMTVHGDNTITVVRKNLDKLQFDANGRLSSWVDRNDRGVTVTRDSQARISQLTNSSGQNVTLSYGGNGKLSTVQDAIGQRTLLGYDGSSRLTVVSFPDSRTMQFGYNSAGRLTTLTDSRGNVTTFEYGMVALHDTYGQLSGKVNASGQRRSFGDNSLSSTRITDYQGNAYVYYWDDQRRVSTAIDPLGYGSYYAYTGDSKVSVATDALGNRTQYAYDARGNVTSVTDPLGNKTFYTYNSLGLVSSVTTPAGRTTTYVYDAKGNLLTITNPLNDTMTYTYDAQGHVTSVTTFAGAVTTYGYDGHGWLLSETDPLNNTTTYEYDGLGRRVAVIDAMGNRTTYTYNTYGLVTQIRYPDLTTESMGYDGRRLIAKTDRRGNTTSFAHDALGHLIQVTDPTGAVTRFGYDASGRQTSVTDALGNITSRTYNTKGRLTQVVYPGGQTERYTYDALDRVISKVDPAGTTTTYTYDAAGRLVRTQRQ
jgi:YD repeat-containing protein